MKEAQKKVVLSLFTRSLEALIKDKQKIPKTAKKLKKFKAKINFGLQIEENEYLWFNLI